MIHLTTLDGRLVDIEKDTIRNIEPLGDGAVVYLEDGAPLRVMQSVSWIMALWKR